MSQELPSGLAALVADLQETGFTVALEERSPWPGGGHIELAAPPGRAGVSRVRMIEDHGGWSVEAKIHGAWSESLTALRALDRHPHEQRAMSHEERRNATLELVRRFTGEPAQVEAIEARERELAEAYNRRAEGKSDANPLG